MPNARIDWPRVFTTADFDFIHGGILDPRIAMSDGLTVEAPSLGAVPDREYFCSGDGAVNIQDGADLLTALAVSISSFTGSAVNATVELTADFRVRITTDVPISLLWTNADPGLAEVFGFDSATDLGPDQEFIGTAMPYGIWRPGRPISLDSRDMQPIVGGHSVAISGLTESVRVALPSRERDITFQYIAPERALMEYATADEPWGTFERLWLEGATLSHALRVYEDEAGRDTLSFRAYVTRDQDQPMANNGRFQYWRDIALRLRRAA